MRQGAEKADPLVIGSESPIARAASAIETSGRNYVMVSIVGKRMCCLAKSPAAPANREEDQRSHS